MADIRDVCFAAAEHFEHEAVVCRRAASAATSAESRRTLQGKARAHAADAAYMRAVGSHQP